MSKNILIVLLLIGCAGGPAETEFPYQCQSDDARAFQATLSDSEERLRCVCQGPTCERAGGDCMWNPDHPASVWARCMENVAMAVTCADLETAAMPCVQP